MEGALHAKLPVRVQVRTVEADDGRDGMRGCHARSLLLEGGGGDRGGGAGRGGRWHDNACNRTSHCGEILHRRSEQIEMKKRSHHDGASDVEAILPNTKPQPQMVFPKKAKSIISNNLDWTESTVPGEICWQNKAMQIECDENCQDRGGCYNKRIQKCKVKKGRKKRGKKGFGLFADEDIQKGEYVIEYVGKIVYKDPDNKYGMKYKDFDLWVDGSKTKALAKCMNHSCNPNSVNDLWAVKGMPRLCFFANRKIVK